MNEDLQEMLDDAYVRVRALDDAAHADALLAQGGAFETLIEKARDEALVALNELITDHTMTLETLRLRQWEVSRYEALVSYISDIIEDANEIRELTSEDEEEDMRQLLRGETEEEDD